MAEATLENIIQLLKDAVEFGNGGTIRLRLEPEKDGENRHEYEITQDN